MRVDETRFVAGAYPVVYDKLRLLTSVHIYYYEFCIDTTVEQTKHNTQKNLNYRHKLRKSSRTAGMRELLNGSSVAQTYTLRSITILF